MTHLILFDIDGTLIRAGTDVHRRSFDHAYRTVFGLPLSLDGIAAAGRTDTWLYGEPLRRAGVPEADIAAGAGVAFTSMCEYVDTHLDDLRHCVLPGVPETLAALRRAGALLGLLTGNLEPIAHAKLRHAGLDGWFTTGGFGEASALRDDLVPVALSRASALAGRQIDARSAVIVGDTPLDIAAGIAHGVHACGVATGPFPVEALQAAGADLVLSSLQGNAAGRLLGLVAPS